MQTILQIQQIKKILHILWIIKKIMKNENYEIMKN